MKSSIKDRLKQLILLRKKVASDKNTYVDKSSYLQMVDFNIEVVRDLVNLIEAVNRDDQKFVSKWFHRFREE